MKLQKLPDGSILLSRLNPWDVQTFRSLPDLADFSTDPASEKRLLPNPAIDADLSPEMAMDWVEYVVPEIRESFAGSLDVVLADLKSLTEEPQEPELAGNENEDDEVEADVLEDAPEAESGSVTHYRLTIPADHAEHWFRAMNQARIVLSTRYGIDSEHLPDLARLLESGKLEHWFQYELFVSLQGWLIEVVLDPD